MGPAQGPRGQMKGEQEQSGWYSTWAIPSPMTGPLHEHPGSRLLNSPRAGTQPGPGLYCVSVGDCMCVKSKHHTCFMLYFTMAIDRDFSSVQSLSRVRLFETPWTTACQASMSITNSQSSLKLMSIESVMPSSHLILCRPLLLLPPIPLSIRVFSNESVLHIRWPK